MTYLEMLGLFRDVVINQRAYILVLSEGGGGCPMLTLFFQDLLVEGG